MHPGRERRQKLFDTGKSPGKVALSWVIITPLTPLMSRRTFYGPIKVKRAPVILHPLSISIRAARDKILKPTLVHDKGQACAPAAAKKAYGELKTSLRAP
jgi:hypothetical protein